MKPCPDPELILAGGAPFYSQIEQQIRAHLLARRLLPGDELPTVRSVAAALAINPSAVQKAYAALESTGWISTEDHSGVFAAAVPPRGHDDAHNRAKLSRFCLSWIASARDEGFSINEVVRTTEAIIQRRNQP